MRGWLMAPVFLWSVCFLKLKFKFSVKCAAKGYLKSAHPGAV